MAILPLLLIHEEQLSVNGECARSTGDFPRNIVVRITDRSVITSIIFH